ncbi:MAG TPA: ATP-binding protein, partial [Clostridiales bacterium]|nr:ATP-binding protein [Clostridiales bacterium]
MANCDHNCETCGEKCDKSQFIAKPKPTTKIGKMIAVMSGKGGVGKSLVTSLLAVAANRRGFAAGILDADVTGPSIPKIFGVHSKALSTGEYLLPVYTDNGIGMMSVNLVLDDENEPVIWRGPVI